MAHQNPHPLRDVPEADGNGVRAFVVFWKGQDIFNHHRAAIRPDDPQSVNSVTKSVVAMLVGIALHQPHAFTLHPKRHSSATVLSSPTINLWNSFGRPISVRSPQSRLQPRDPRACEQGVCYGKCCKLVNTPSGTDFWIGYSWPTKLAFIGLLPHGHYSTKE
ncbi:hypothetical protein [Paraburkholderia sp. BL10I2N1]|uniref:hypothetical protein n=1 Tax=Paraburkholderia sp. BL10I2N1 TaxID=1938796 RepID=UPI00105E500A|nr:hypothetical protein [Paraburkholderia sp. BL10I2N1]TDN61911.1 hypothetical protein B0G77_5419 [Paraburkholderia sp. BL10I2N1]